MGFGLMLCGYFILTLMSFGMGAYSFAAYMLGGVISFIAAGKLYAYKHSFSVCMGTSVFYMLLGVYYAMATLDTALLWNLPLFRESVTKGLSTAVYLLETAHTLAMLWAVRALAESAGVEKVREGAGRNAILTVLWAVSQMVLVLFPAVAAFQEQTITKIVLLFELLVYLCNAWLLYRAYQMICPVGEEEGKPRKPSRIAWVNRVHETLEERSQRAIRETQAYQEEKLNKKKLNKKQQKKQERRGR